MPFVRIYVDQSRSDAEIETLLSTLQACLETSFTVPKGDQFHLVHRLSEADKAINKSYAMPPEKQRDNSWILIEVTGGKPRSKEVKAHFYNMTAKRISESLDMDPANIMIVLSSNTIEDWSFSCGEMARLPQNPISQPLVEGGA